MNGYVTNTVVCLYSVHCGQTLPPTAKLSEEAIRKSTDYLWYKFPRPTKPTPTPQTGHPQICQITFMVTVAIAYTVGLQQKCKKQI